MLGRLKQPSCPGSRSPLRINTGLHTAIGGAPLWSGNRITNSLLVTPTCGAANPTPLDASIVAISCRENSSSCGPNSLPSILSQTLDSTGSSQYRKDNLSTAIPLNQALHRVRVVFNTRRRTLFCSHSRYVDVGDGRLDLCISQYEILVHRKPSNDLELKIHVQRLGSNNVAVEVIEQDGERKLRGSATSIAPAKARRGMVHDFETGFQIKSLAFAVHDDAVNVADLVVVDDASGIHGCLQP